MDQKDDEYPLVQAVAPLVIAPRHAESYKESLERQMNTGKVMRRSARSKRQILPRGIWNAGQSCHLGASLTALSVVPVLRIWLRMQTPGHNSCFATLKQYLLEASASTQRQGLDPRPILSMLEYSLGWKPRHAQDAHETMARILEILEDWSLRAACDVKDVRSLSLEDQKVPCRVEKRSSNKMPKFNTLMPFSMVTVTSQECYHCSHRSELFLHRGSTVILPCPSAPQSLASLFVSSQISCETLEMQCHKCGVWGKHRRNSDIKRLPDLLIVHLHKAEFISGYTKATEGRVTVPITMELPEGRPIRGLTRLREYYLCSVVQHWGGAGGASHFDCILRKNSGQGLASISEGTSWWHVDDDKVWLTTLQAACDARRAYLVLYQSYGYKEE